MIRLVLMLLFATGVHAAVPPVDIETAAGLYHDAAIREQVRASLGTMPDQIRRLFEGDNAARLSEQQLAAVTAAAERGFRLDVFEAPALNALAANLDAATVKKASAFFAGDVGKRMVAADLALATQPQDKINKIMSGEITAPSTPQRDALFVKIDRASKATDSAVQVFLTMGSAVAVGTAVGAGTDPEPAAARSRQAGEASRAALAQNMHEPLLRYLTYGYRDLSDAELKAILAFFESTAGQQYVVASGASMRAGFDAMGRRCGEQLGESLRELAMAQLAADPPRADPPR